MNRRSFFKAVTGFVAGAVAVFVPKAIGSKRSGTGIRYCGETSTSIDPNSEWAKQKYLTLDEICRRERKVSQDIYGEPDMLYSRSVWYQDDTKLIDARCDCPEQRVIVNGSRLIVTCVNHEPYFLYPDGEIGEIYSYRTGKKIV